MPVAAAEAAPQEPLMDKYGMAKILGLNPETVVVKARRGEIGHTKAGNRYRFTRAHADAYIKAHEFIPGETAPPKRNPKYRTNK